MIIGNPHSGDFTFDEEIYVAQQGNTIGEQAEPNVSHAGMGSHNW